MFPPSNNSVISTCRERAAELKDKIRQAYSTKKDKRNRSVLINKNYRIEIKLTCYESNKFKLKTKQIIVKFVPQDKSYYDIYLLARKHFNIPKITHTFLGQCNGKNISETFESIETYALAKNKKEHENSVIFALP